MAREIRIAFQVFETCGSHRVDGDFDTGGRLLAFPAQLVDPACHLLVGDQLGRAVIVAQQIADIAALGLLSAFSPAANGQVPDMFCS